MELKNMLSGLENLKVKGSLDIDISKIKNNNTLYFGDNCCFNRI